MMGERFAVRFLNALVTHPPPALPSGLLLGHATDRTGHSLVLPDTRRCEHLVVLGKTGSGKTHFFETLVLQHFIRREGFAAFDYHGDPTQHLLGLAAGIPEAADRLLLVDLADSRVSPGLNPLQLDSGDDATAFRLAAALTAILKRRWHVDAFGARTEELLRNSLYTLAINGQTVVEAPLLLTSRSFRQRLVAMLPNADVVSYWRERFEPLSEPMKAVFREPLLNKITAFLADPIPRHLLGQPLSTIDFTRALREGHQILINLAKGSLGDHAHTLGNLIFACLQHAILARASLPERHRRVFSIFCDEVQNLAENDLVTLLAEGRKFGASVATAGQFWQQSPTELRGALLSAGTHVLFRLSAADARVLAPELSASDPRRYINELTTLPQGEAIVRMGWAAPKRLRVPPLPCHVSPESAAFQSLKSRAMTPAVRARATIEAQIQQRHNSFNARAAVRGVDAEEQAQGRHEGQAGW